MVSQSGTGMPNEQRPYNNLIRRLRDADYALIAPHCERVERAATLQPENAAPLSRGAVALVHLGDTQKAISWITRALTIDPEDPVTQYNAAAVHSLLGNQNAAIRILQNYLQHVSDDMIDVLRNDGDFDGIRSHPRYADLVARVRV